MNQIKKKYPEMKVDIAVFALAGIDSKQDKENVRLIIEEVCRSCQLEVRKYLIENDAESTMIGATGKKPGVLLISGTGSIVFAHDAKGKVVRSGGWGHRVGDEGSGYWMGREVLRAIFRMEDGRGPSTILKYEVLQELNLNAVGDIAEWLYNGSTYSVDRIAKLSAVLARCVEQGDDVSIRIAEEAADELALLIVSVLRKCKLENRKLSVYLNGGTITHFRMLRVELENRLKAQLPLCELVESTKSPIEYIVTRGWLE